MTYNDLKEGDLFLINDIKAMPKRKTSDGYIDLVTGETTRDKDIPENIKTGFTYEVIDEIELNYWKDKLNLTFVG